MIELDLDRTPDPAEPDEESWRQRLRLIRPAAVAWAAAFIAFLLSLMMAWIGFATFGDVFGVNAILKIGVLDGAGTFDSAITPVYLVGALILLALAWPAGVAGVAQRALRGAAIGIAAGMLSIEIAVAVRPMRFIRAEGIDHHDDKALSGVYYAIVMTALAVVAALARRREPDVPRRSLRTLLPGWPKLPAAVRQAAPAGLVLVAVGLFLASLSRAWIKIDESQQGTFGAAAGIFATSFGPAYMLGAVLLLGLAGAAIAEPNHGTLLRSATLALAGGLLLVLLLVQQQPSRFMLRPLIPSGAVPTPIYHAQSGLALGSAVVVLAALAVALAHPLRPARRVETAPPPSTEPFDAADDQDVISR